MNSFTVAIYGFWIREYERIMNLFHARVAKINQIPAEVDVIIWKPEYDSMKLEDLLVALKANPEFEKFNAWYTKFFDATNGLIMMFFNVSHIPEGYENLVAFIEEMTAKELLLRSNELEIKEYEGQMGNHTNATIGEVINAGNATNITGGGMNTTGNSTGGFLL